MYIFLKLPREEKKIIATVQGIVQGVGKGKMEQEKEKERKRGRASKI